MSDDRSATAAFSPSSRLESHAVLRLAPRTYRGRQHWATLRRYGDGAAWGNVQSQEHCAIVLGHAEFLRALELEKRRADRSNSPLSMVLFRTRSHDADGSGTRCLCALLQGCTRETDKLGRLDSGDVAVVLPDTDEQGRERFTAKIVQEGDELSLSVVGATYPDELFASLDAGREAVPAGSLMLDDAADAPARTYPLKRALDVLGASIALVLLAPLMLVVTIAVAATSPGPVIFRQQRLGKGGAPFVFYKFRSMRVDADDSIHRKFVGELIKGEATPSEESKANGAPFKLHADPRITPIGRILRKTSIDELPQFLNVLRGDMSLVGPRPPIPYEAGLYKSWHLRRITETRPGITGPWQVEGRSRVTFDDMVRMDLRYIRHCSFWLDLKILLKTVVVVLRCDGAQ